MSDQHTIDLSHKFLIAMPTMEDPNFTGTVVYLCEHTRNGALGLVINRPTDLTVHRLLERLELGIEIESESPEVVFYGGPVHPERGFVLHTSINEYGASIKITDEVSLTTSRDVLQDLAQGSGPERLFISLGYAGWEAGQLESELASNAWLTVDADLSVIFDVPAEKRFQAAIALLGIDPLMLSSTVGHA